MRGLAASVAVACALLAAGPGFANPVSSDELPEALLDACDEQAARFGGYDPTIAASVKDLSAMGVFAETEFSDVKIGFCALRDAGGPAATISCARNTILLDAAYAGSDRRLTLNATLAHEMKHHLQHKKQKAAFGANYCISERYRTDRAWMEPEADAFGDKAGELFFIGRTVEIRNDCPVAVSIYLEPDDPASAIREQRFVEIAPHTVISASERALTKFFKFYAETAPQEGRRWVWRASTLAHRRVIDGKSYALRSITLSNPTRESGPFRLRLSCPQPAAGKPRRRASIRRALARTCETASCRAIVIGRRLTTVRAVPRVGLSQKGGAHGIPRKTADIGGAPRRRRARCIRR